MMRGGAHNELIAINRCDAKTERDEMPLTPNDLAERFNTDSKTIRRFLRSLVERDERPGKGHRWTIDATDATLEILRNRFDTWSNRSARVISLDDLELTD